MSLLLSRRLSRVRRKASLLGHVFSNGFSTWTTPCLIIRAEACGEGEMGRLEIFNANEYKSTLLEKKVPLELTSRETRVTIGASHGWIATLKDDGILRLQDDLNPAASGTDPKRIPLPPLVTLPRCQTQIVTNVSLSSSCPESDEDCVVAVKFLGPQLSFCRPAAAKSEWTNIRVANPCFFSSRVMFSEGDGMFRIPGAGGHVIGSWDLSKKHKHKIQRLRFQNLPELTKAKRELLHSCLTTEHLVESRTTGETFMVKWYRKAAKGLWRLKTRALMVFKLDQQGNAVYTQDIGDLVIFLSNSEPFCVPASSFPDLEPNMVRILDVDENGTIILDTSYVSSRSPTLPAPYYIPPQKIDLQLVPSLVTTLTQ
ncbi:unnamed protein product [Microthlaspi erraticum]|uniref:KIB1-4 beta-propeller domain-containing protein n=1 Tax=Microthlaspi erraticum TaxID=1685480 RepID=A0A6D2ILD9_9BRAS|nr:unnamed protein product [Microthlaspi erraticum]